MPLFRRCKNDGVSTGRTLAMREGGLASEYNPSINAAARHRGASAGSHITEGAERHEEGVS